jgi:toxin ParE1/3/4
MKVIWSPLAIERATEQADYIARDKPEAARRWLESLFDSTLNLGELPNSGRKTPELDDPAFREIQYGSHRVLYRIEVGQVTILTVRHSRRLLDRRELR